MKEHRIYKAKENGVTAQEGCQWTRNISPMVKPVFTIEMATETCLTRQTENINMYFTP